MDKNGGKGILHDYKNNGTLIKTKRKKLVGIIVDLIIDHFGYYPSASEKTMVAKAAVNLFPCFKSSESKDGIVSFTVYTHFNCMYILLTKDVFNLYVY